MRGDHSPVLGFTEAELGIVLALLAAVLVAFRPTREPERWPMVPADSVAALEATLLQRDRSLARARDSVVRQRRTIEAQADTLRQLARFKSAIWPNCAESPPLAIDVLSRRQYRMQGELLGLEEIADRTDAVRQEARRRECRLVAMVRMRSSISGPDYQAALSGLGRLGLRTRFVGTVAE